MVAAPLLYRYISLTLLSSPLLPTHPTSQPFDTSPHTHTYARSADWEQQLLQYVRDNPQVVVVDRLDKIRQVHNRATMLRPLQGDGIILQQVRVCVCI